MQLNGQKRQISVIKAKVILTKKARLHKLPYVNLTFDLSRSNITLLAYISKTIRDRDSGCITDRQEIIPGLSFYAMTFDLG